MDNASTEAFICALLEPLPEGVPIDTQYNSFMRRARKNAWHRAYVISTYYRSLVDYYDAQGNYARVIDNDPDREHQLSFQRAEAIKQWRKAIAAQIRTPAPTRADVTWKVQAAKDAYLPITPEEVAAAIAADEAFLDAHPVSSRAGLPRRATAMKGGKA